MSFAENDLPSHEQILAAYEAAARQARNAEGQAVGVAKRKMVALITAASNEYNQKFQQAWAEFRQVVAEIDGEYGVIEKEAHKHRDAAIAAAKDRFEKARQQIVADERVRIEAAMQRRQGVYRQVRESGARVVFTPAADFHDLRLKAADEAFQLEKTGAAQDKQLAISKAVNRQEAAVQRAHEEYHAAVPSEWLINRQVKTLEAERVRNLAIAAADQEKTEKVKVIYAECDAVVQLATEQSQRQRIARVGVWSAYESALQQTLASLVDMTEVETAAN